jgi:hypothetical protein|uniref:Nucleotide-diphospho-sugar transferase domain-containing protein n=1 Tax=viral metagenome TaxID=1070528 RepID=A0A6C0J231_9ZZZZ
MNKFNKFIQTCNTNLVCTITFSIYDIVDHVLVINHKTDTENANTIKTILEHLCIDYTFIEPIQAKKRNKNINQQECSYYLTWIEILNKYNGTLLIMDNDVRPITNFHAMFSFIYKTIPSNWEIIYLGGSQHNWNYVNTNKYPFCYEAYNTKGSFALLLNNPKKILKILETYDLICPLDEAINSMTSIHRYVMKPNIFISDVSISSIRKNRMQITQHANKMKWELNCYDYFKYFKPHVLLICHSSIQQSYLNTCIMKVSYKNKKEVYKSNFAINNKICFVIIALKKINEFFFVENLVNNFVNNNYTYISSIENIQTFNKNKIILKNE